MELAVTMAMQSGTMTFSKLILRSRVSQQALVHLRLKPVRGTPGKPLRRELVLLDKFSRDFPIGPIELPYIGQVNQGA